MGLIAQLARRRASTCICSALFGQQLVDPLATNEDPAPQSRHAKASELNQIFYGSSADR